MTIYEAINKTMQDVGAVGKNEKNPQQGWKFRGIDAVMNALNPAMVKNGIFVVPEVLNVEREERVNNKGTTLLYSILTMQYTFYADDGTSVKAVVIGEAMDSGDKSMNKAMSAAFKYACFQTFCIPTEEMKDPDTEVHEVAPKADDKAKNDALISEVGGMTISTIKMEIVGNKAKEAGVAMENVLEKFGLDSIGSMTEAQFTEAIAMLQKQIDLSKKGKK